MRDRYTLFPNETPPNKEAKRRRVSPEDVQALQRRAEAWANLPGHGKARIQAQAREAYALYLDYIRHAIGGDFPRWLSRHSGVPHITCWKRLKAGRALAAGAKPNRNQSGLLDEQRDREQTPCPEPLDWSED